MGCSLTLTRGCCEGAPEAQSGSMVPLAPGWAGEACSQAWSQLGAGRALLRQGQGLPHLPWVQQLGLPGEH